jgi:hypothetical protein
VAVANSGYTFSGWGCTDIDSGNDVAAIANTGSATTTLTMNGNYQVIAYFVSGSGSSSSSSYGITASAGSNGSISPSGTTYVSSGNSQTFTITPNYGYRVDIVYVDGASVGAITSYTFSSVTTSHTISANFALNTFAITASAGANGTITPSGSISVNYGGSQAFTITPVSGYHITAVLVDGVTVGTSGTYTFSNIATAHTISATFAINTYSLIATTGANGVVSPAGTTTVNFGASQIYTITPNTGYHVAGVLVDNAQVGALTSYTFPSVISDHTISASFAINTYTLNSLAGSNGTISPSGAKVVDYGSSQTYTITPATGYHVFDVQLDGVSVGAVTTYQLTNIVATHTIAVGFAINTYTLTPTTGQHGTISPSVETTVNYGDSVTFTIKPQMGYAIADVQVDSVSVGKEATYNFNKVNKNHTIEATFTLGWPLYVAIGIGVLFVFLIGYLIGKKSGGGGY